MPVTGRERFRYGGNHEKIQNHGTADRARGGLLHVRYRRIRGGGCGCKGTLQISAVRAGCGHRTISGMGTSGDSVLDARDLTLIKRALLDPQAQQPADRKLVFSEEFDGDAVDLRKWSYDRGNWKLDKDGNYITNGWGNNEQQFYTDKNAAVKDGVLTIAARHESYTDEKQGSYEYTSAKLTTAQKFSVTGGRIEVRARCDAGKSLWPAIWMLPEDELYGGWAASGEIDIMEGWGSTPEKICGTIHFGGTWPNNRYLTADYNFPAGTSAADWHVYAVEWKRNCIQWYVDDQLYSTQTEWSADGYERPAPFDQDFYLILNLAVGGHFDGVDGIYGDPATFADGEKQFQIDYVRVYEPEEDFMRTSWPSLPLELYTEGADAELHNSEHGTAVTVRSTGEKEYAVMALRRGIDVRANTAYNVVFDASCDQPRDMVVTLEDSAYNRLLEQKITLTPEAKHYALAVTVPSNMAADLKFQLGSVGDAASLPAHTVTLTDVRFLPIQ